MKHKEHKVNSPTSMWITWEQQTRNSSMANLLNIPLYQITTNRKKMSRYVLLSARTIALLISRRPKNLFVQNPSIVLAFLATFLRKPLGYTLFVDAHNAAIDSLFSSNRLIRWISSRVVKSADYTIVTNPPLAELVQKHGGSPIVATDPIPSFQGIKGQQIYGGNDKYFLFICSWASDEPYLSVIEAFSQLGHDYQLLITGNFHKVLSSDEVKRMPSNISLLGFVSESEYLSYLKNSVASIDLTTRENCLVCGAYESMSLARPCLLSNTEANRSTFTKGFTYCENESSSIKKSIRHITKNISSLEHDIRIERDRHNELSERTRNQILKIVELNS